MNRSIEHRDGPHRYCTAAEARREIIAEICGCQLRIENAIKHKDALVRELQTFKPKRGKR